MASEGGSGGMTIMIILLILGILYFMYDKGYLSFVFDKKNEGPNSNAPKIDSITIGLSNAPPPDTTQ